jgi:hypothetical protein
LDAPAADVPMSAERASASTMFHKLVCSRSARCSAISDAMPVPPPGYLVGGPNQDYFNGQVLQRHYWNAGILSAVFARYVATVMRHRSGSRRRQFNEGSPSNSWESRSHQGVSSTMCWLKTCERQFDPSFPDRMTRIAVIMKDYPDLQLSVALNDLGARRHFDTVQHHIHRALVNPVASSNFYWHSISVVRQPSGILRNRKLGLHLEGIGTPNRAVAHASESPVRGR